MNYFKILTFLEKGNKFLFDIPIIEQKAFILKLGYAKDDIDRSKKQYLCQMYFVPKWKVYLFDVIAIFALPCYLLFYWVKSLFSDKKLIKKVDCVCEEKKMPEVLPEAFISQYEISFDPWHSGKFLLWKDILFIVKCFLKSWSPFMIFKCAAKISEYSYMIHRYQPRAIQVCGEYSFTSSVLTEYCHLYGVKHIDVMHGEKLYYIRDSYFHFDRTYVWHEHYKNLFLGLNAEPNQFIVAVPPSLKVNCKAHKNENAYADFKYYLALNSEEEIKKLSETLELIRQIGKTIKVRLHPRYSDFDLVKRYFKDEEIEKPSDVPILESISNLEYAIGSYTTVLTQAYLSGQKIILDDVVYAKMHQQLKEMDYLLANDDIFKLSQLKKILTL